MECYNFRNMRHISDTTNKNLIMQKFPDLLRSLKGVKCYDIGKLKSKGRIQRIPNNNERRKRIERLKKPTTIRFKKFDSAFFIAMENRPFLFSCPICRNILRGPITVDCGHTFCSSCLELTNSNLCVVCSIEIGDKRFVNVLIQDLVEKWREKNKHNTALCSMVSNSYDVVGVEPRYHLRSGYAGLLFKRETKDNMRNFISKTIGKEKLKRHKSKTKNKLATSNINIDQETLYQFLNNLLTKLSQYKEQALRDSWRCLTVSDLECVLCSRCFLDPVATGCGHTFCRGCLTRVLDYGLSCPLCKSQLTVSDYARGPTFALHRAINFLAPREYNERMRCLQSPAKLFAMAAKENNGQKFASFGTMLEIKDAVTLEDGRFILTTVGIRRFRVVNSDEKDGYDTAKVQYIRDNDVPADKLPELINLHQKVYNKAIKWIRSFKPKVLSEVERLIGQMPEVESNWTALPDGPSWTWWLMPLLPLSSKLQLGFLSTSSLEKRLRAIDKMLEHMKVRMKALEGSPDSCADSDDSSSESCQYVLPFHTN
ncbi:unnamed protein product [Brassicogethes aeneus]|uniref:LON peptidase N-terminal domain and RING finger protein 3 n=1 Tax=Brassicogethes aeneus TaxID=1431903 RepID=A0A9P0FBN5_BRAAE|nr:unnamed protein product [Brassicogethes aeneus]